MSKKTILIDLDGVLNTYSGNYDEDYIPPLKDGAYEFLRKLSENFRIVIFTSRKLLPVSKWIIKNELEEFIDNVTNIKEPCYLIIDDRCIDFSGDYKEAEKKINNFKVYYM